MMETTDDNPSLPVVFATNYVRGAIHAASALGFHAVKLPITCPHKEAELVTAAIRLKCDVIHRRKDSFIEIANWPIEEEKKKEDHPMEEEKPTTVELYLPDLKVGDKVSYRPPQSASTKWWTDGVVFRLEATKVLVVRDPFDDVYINVTRTNEYLALGAIHLPDLKINDVVSFRKGIFTKWDTCGLVQSMSAGSVQVGYHDGIDTLKDVIIPRTNECLALGGIYLPTLRRGDPVSTHNVNGSWEPCSVYDATHADKVIVTPFPGVTMSVPRNKECILMREP